MGGRPTRHTFVGCRGHLLLFACVVAHGCAGAGSGSSAPTGSAPRGNANLITSEQLRAPAVSFMSADAAIRFLRPRWLRSRSGTPVGGRNYAYVFMDGGPFGNIRTLPSLQASDIGEARFITAADATTRYGTGYPGGIIAIASRRRR